MVIQPYVNKLCYIFQRHFDVFRYLNYQLICTFLDLYLAKIHRNENNIIVFMMYALHFSYFDVETNKQERKVTLRQLLLDPQLLTLRFDVVS